MRLVLLLFAVSAGCSTKKPLEYSHKAAARQFPVQGAIVSLGFAGKVLRFCDSRGSHRVGEDDEAAAVDGSPCPEPQDQNTSCQGFTLDVSVRTPPGEPNDIVDIGASSFPLHGHVHDCAASGSRLVIGTGSAVVLIDAAQNTAKTISEEGSERVAVTRDWVAWAAAGFVHLAPL
jgi:hypothetical protein